MLTYIQINAASLAGATPTSLCSTLMTQTRTGGLAVPSAAMCRKIFKPKANAFYDGREDLRADMIDVYIDSLRIWSDSAPSTRAPRIIYFEITNTNTNAGNDYVAVRLRGGARLPKSRVASDTGGLTIATDRPVYVLGDYNTQVWRPAAIMGDAVTFLSNPPANNPGMLYSTAVPSASRCTTGANPSAWCDTLQYNYAKRTASGSTVNAAILAGHSATPCDYARSGCGSPAYGGGLENFPRFLEHWGSVVFRYTGSLVSLFQSRYSTGLWGNTTGGGAYYDPPTRQWSFDVNFRFPERLPPGTPSVGTVLQTAFRPLY